MKIAQLLFIYIGIQSFLYIKKAVRERDTGEGGQQFLTDNPLTAVEIKKNLLPPLMVSNFIKLCSLYLYYIHRMDIVK
jgi:hypothetical protein